MKVTFGLDISSAIVGLAIVSGDKLIYHDFHSFQEDKKKKINFFDSLEKFKHKILKIKHDFKVTHIAIEEPIEKVSGGSSNSKTISLLYRYNYSISYMCYELFGIKPEYISSSKARRNLGINKNVEDVLGFKYYAGTKPKKIQALNVICDKFPVFKNELTFSNNNILHAYWFDVIDAIVIALAG